MKRMKFNLIILCSIIFFVSLSLYSQHFEEDQLTSEVFEKKKVEAGGAFALQLQMLNHDADSALIPLGKGINLPTANFNLDAYLAPGIKVNLVTYLSSRHHNDAWVKGGYLLIDEMPFFKSQGINTLMEYLTLKAGVMEINYGDAHFRRSDNGNVTQNPFVGNYIMDAFTTAPSLEILYRRSGIIAMAAITNGTLRPDLVRFSSTTNTYTAYNIIDELGFYGKVGYDKQFNDNLRLRLTVSGYHMGQHHFGSLYNGDRAGSRYYLIMNRQANSSTDVDISSNAFSGRWGPGVTDKDNSLMVNLFSKFRGLEVFASYESVTGTSLSGNEFKFGQVAAEALYRFGPDEQFYAGVRYNMVNGDTNTAVDGDQSVNRVQVGAGWFILESTVLKLEYVNQTYTDFISQYGADAGFNGLMVEAAISF